MDTDEEHPITSTGIAEALQNYGIDAERKSICRDVNILKDDAGYDIVQSEDNKKGYYMASRDFEDWEIKILIDAVWSSKFLTKGNAKKLSEKLLNLTSASSRKMLKAVAPIQSKLRSANVITKINIDILLKAIKRGRKIAFKYTYIDSDLQTKLRRDGFTYVINPYTLIWRDGYYYLIGNYDTHDNLSYYRLDRLKDARISDEPAKPVSVILGENADLKLEEYIRTALYNYGGEKIKLLLEINSDMVDNLIDYFGSDLVFKKHGEKWRTYVNVLEGEGLYYWLMQYGKNIKVLEPIKVREKLICQLKETLKIY